MHLIAVLKQIQENLLEYKLQAGKKQDPCTSMSFSYKYQDHKGWRGSVN